MLTATSSLYRQHLSGRREGNRWRGVWTHPERALAASRVTEVTDHAAGDTRLLLLTTAQNEVRFVNEFTTAVLGQSRLPDRWIVVDDGSTDGTFEALSERLRSLEWVTVLRRDARPEHVPDRLATAAVPRALNWVLERVELDEFTHVGKLDADVALPPSFTARLLKDFAADPDLGMTGGVLTEFRRGRWVPVMQPKAHAPPPARLYTRACFQACGGFREQLGWDTIDEVYARMRGFKTGVSYDVPVRHMRVLGSADGTLRGRARHGRCAWIAHYPLWFVLLRSLKLAGRFPPGVSGVAFLSGYIGAMLQATPQVEDQAFRRFVRSELRARLSRFLR